MQVIGYAQVYDVHVRALEHPRVVDIRVRDAVPTTVRLNTLLRTANRGDEARLVPCNTSVGAGACLGDEARADDGDIDLSSRHWISV